MRSQELLSLSAEHSAHNYHPLPVVIAEASGAWVTDVDGKRYLDMLAAYSAVNFGHRNPRITAAAKRQFDRVTLVSRAFDHDEFGLFAAELGELAGKEMVLPMNSGAEAVETALKTARKWGYEVKGVPPAAPRSSPSWATSTAGPPPSSASRPTSTPGSRSAPSPRASSRCRTATPTRCVRR